MKEKKTTDLVMQALVLKEISNLNFDIWMIICTKFPFFLFGKTFEKKNSQISSLNTMF